MADDSKEVLIHNRKARFDYHILETYEAGMVLSGGEVKSIRAGECSIQESYVRPQSGEIFLIRAHIAPYKFTAEKEYDPLRTRKLLMHAKEIAKLAGKVAEKGLTLVPLSLYVKAGKLKLEIGLAKGKNAPDKRDTIKSRDLDRQMRRDR